MIRPRQVRAATTGIAGLLGAASPLVLALLGSTGPAHAQAVNLDGAGVNNIRADGRTKTRIEVDGNHTKIRTETVSGDVGFNSFSDFQQAAGTRVDLFVPDRAGSLVNVVRDGSIVVNGTLNAYKDGRIGGDVYFSSPDGFVLGAQGQVNVGSLTINTPERAFLDNMIGADGRIDASLAHQLMTGEIPISETGHIAIAGEVNAEGGITLQGQTIRIGGDTGPLTFSDLGQRTKFEATVNSTGLVEGGRLVSRGGRIVIEAVDAAAVAGRVSVDGAEDGGEITIRGGTIRLAMGTRVSADGGGTSGAGGDIVVLADEMLFAAAGARFSATGAGTGNGGFLELSGRTAWIDAVNVSLGSQAGRDGLFLIDPFDLVIGGASDESGAGNDYSLTRNIRSDGADVRLEADNSITVTGDGLIDTRDLDAGGVSEGDSGSITLEAPEIVLAPGAELLAGVTAGSVFSAGDVMLTATRAGGTARIALGDAGGSATITGGAITLSAGSVIDSSSFLPEASDASALIDIANATISATGTLSASATASVTSGPDTLPVGFITMDVQSAVTIGGGSNVTAGSVDLDATSAAISRVQTDASLNPVSSTADGAVAVSDVTSHARVQVLGSAMVNSTGAMTLDATNSVTSVANATPELAPFGASVGVSLVDAATTVEIAGGADVSTGALGLSASTATDVTVTAAAAAGGANEPEAGSEARRYLDDAAYGQQASTSGGQVSVVGALAISDIASTTRAAIASSRMVQAGGAVSATARSDNAAAITADGSAVDSATGVGVAVGINRAKISADATLSGPISAASVALSARNAAAGQRFTTTVTSGAGASNVGIAGGFALNLVDTGFAATIAPGTLVTIAGGGAVSLSADNSSETAGSATPTGGGATGETVGVGASVAINIVANRSTAEIGDGAEITGADDVSLDAKGDFTALAQADAGSGGGVSLTPALGLSLVTNTTTARIGTGAALSATGAVTLSALQEAATTTGASGKAAGANVALGAAVGVALVEDTVTATTARGIGAGGAVSFSAAGASSSKVEVEASAAGAAPAEDDGSTPSSGKNVDETVNAELDAGASKQKSAGIGDTDQQSLTEATVSDEDGRSAETSGGKLSVAAAIGVNVQDATVSASVPDGQAIDAGGVLSLLSDANTTGEVTTTGDAVGKEDESGATPPASAVGIGAAVSVNKVAASNTARLGVADHNAKGLAMRATARDVAALRSDPATTDTVRDSYRASATSGAGASNVGLAGSLGLNLVDTESRAVLPTGATLAISGGGAVSLSADGQTDTTAEALPTGGGASGDTVGVGASVAINILANRSRAEIEDGATLTGAGAVELSAEATHAATADASAGSAGGVAVTPALGLSIVSNSTTARIGTGAALSAASVRLSAAQESATITKASGEAAGANVAVGAAVAIALVDDAAPATTGRDITTTGAVTFTALGASSSEVEAKASAAGAAPAEDDGSVPSGGSGVDGTVTGELTAGSSKQQKSGVGSSEQQMQTQGDASDESTRSASTTEGKVSVAAAIGVNQQSATVRAEVPDAVTISAGGTLGLTTSANTAGKVTTTGDAVGKEDENGETPPPSAVGIGAAVSVNLVKASNTARLGVAAHSAGGLTMAALSRDVAAVRADPTSTTDKADAYLASATSGAGASKVGIAGALGLNLIDTESSAILSSGASVAMSGGDVEIATDNRTKTTAEAKPVGAGATGATVGIGASVAINILANRSLAEIADGAAITGAAAMTLSAEATHEATADAAAGSAGGVSITPVLGLSIIANDTTARLGTGPVQALGEALSVSATQSSTTVTNAAGDAAGANVAIGAAVAVALVDDTATATTGRAVNAGGAVSFAADGASSSSLEVKASAVGAKAADDDGNAQAGSRDVNSNVDDQMSAGTNRQSSAGVGSASQQSRSTAGANDKSSREARTSEGKVNVAAAIGVNVQTHTVTAAVPDGVAIIAGGALGITATADTDAANTTTGDALGEPDKDGKRPPASQVGIGAAVSVNVVKERNSATLGVASHSAQGVNLSARQAAAPTASDVDTVTVSASAGAGGSKVGIAGAVALNIVDMQNTARIASGATVDAGTGASVISADERLTAEATAAPVDRGATGGQVGVGASVALNFVDVRTTAELADGAALINGAGLAVTANSRVDTTTTAKAGAAGGIAVDASLALALLDTRTTARIGTGAALDMSGAVSVSATSGGAHVALSEGENKGGKVAVGASAAVIFGDGESDGALRNSSETTAVVARDVTAGSLAISAASNWTYTADASATARGGFFSDSDPKKNETTGGTATSTDSLDKSKDKQRGTKDNNKVAVAAAAGIASAQDRTIATLEAVTVDLTGALSVTAANTVGLATSGSGAALDPQANVGVGIGVALSILDTTTVAEIADGATIARANGITVTATTRENADGDFLDRVSALAVSGASGRKVSVAGALAVGIASGSSRASIGDEVTISDGGAVNVAVTNTSQMSAKSLAGSVSGKNGIGASVAVVVSEKSYDARVGAGVDMTAASLSVTATNQRISGPAFSLTPVDTIVERLRSSSLLGASNYYVEALGGAAGGSNAVQGSFGVMTFDDDLNASVGESRGDSSAATTVNAGGGSVTIGASGQLTAKALSGAISAAGSNAIGVASSVIVSEGSTTSRLADSATITNAASYSGTALADQEIQVFGVAVSGGISNGVSGVATVLTSENTVEALIGRAARVSINGAGAATLTANNHFDSFSLATGVGVGGSNGIGASGSVTVVNNITRATIADGTGAADRAEINTAGTVNIGATATTESDTIGIAGGAGGTVGAGAGAGIYVFDTETTARMGAFARVGSAMGSGGLTVSASDTTNLSASSGAASGGGTAGVGAAVAVGVLTKTTTAEIGASADVDAFDVSVSATSTEDILGIAAGLGVGGTAGVAGSVSVNSITTTTLARIAENASVMAGGSVGVLADGVSRVDMVDAAVGGGTVGVGASVGVSVISTNTQAVIADGAQVTALGAGAGLSYTSGLTPGFSAYGADDDFSSANISPSSDDDAPVKTSTSAENNELLTSDDARATGIALLMKERGVTRQTATGTGVLVNASSQTRTRSLSVGAAAGGTAVTLSASVPVITTVTAARIGDASINQGPGTATGAQDVSVAALSDHYMLGFSGAIAGGGPAFGAGVSMAVINTTTTASTGGGATITAAGDLAVRAETRQDLSTMAAAGAIGSGFALAGGASVTDLTTRTTATPAGTVRVDGNADVVAQDTTRNALLAGSVAISDTAGFGAAVAVLNLDKIVTASVAANSDVTALGNSAARTVFGDVDPDGLGGTNIGYSTTRASQGLNVLASSAQSSYTLAIAGSGGLYAGLAGVVGLNLFNVETSAFIGANAKINTGPGTAAAQQDVVVTARDTTVTDVAAGAIAVGAVSLAGTIDVGLFKTNTTAYVDDGAQINARRDVVVSGLSNKAGDSFTVSGSVGLGALAAGVAVYSYGDGVASGGEADKQLADSSDQDGNTASLTGKPGDADDKGLVGDAQKQVDDKTVDRDLLSQSDDDDVKRISAQAQAARETVDLAAATGTLDTPGGTSASIRAATINAGGQVGVASDDRIALEIETGAAAAGVIGVGAGVAVVTVDTGSTARISGAATIKTGGAAVVALTDHEIDVASRAAAAGIFAGVSADVAVIRDSSRTRAIVQEAQIVKPDTASLGAVNIGAGSQRRVTGLGLGVSAAGTVAVGASVVEVELGGAVEARLSDGASVGRSDARAASVGIAAQANDFATADATAVGGGVGVAAQGAYAGATIDTDVDATVRNASIAAAGPVDIRAIARARTATEATGVAVAGLGAAGASLSEASIGTTVDTTVTGGANIDVDGGRIALSAKGGSADDPSETDPYADDPTAGAASDPSVSATSQASAGALVGVTATRATASNTARVAVTADTSTLKASTGSSGATDAGKIAAAATGKWTQAADASGFTAGIVAAGANDSRATSRTVTSATLTDMSSVDAGALSVMALGRDKNTANATSGSGGLVAGSAAEARTLYDGETTAQIETSAPSASFVLDVAGDVSISAEQSTEFAGFVDTRQASLAGKSGAELRHDVASDVTAEMGDALTLLAENLAISARNVTQNAFRGAPGVSGDAADWNVDSVSAGLANVPAGGITVDVRHDTITGIGDGAFVTLRTPDATAGLSTLSIEAANEIETHQKVKLDSGGAIATALAKIDATLDADATARIGTGTEVVVQRGDIEIAAHGAADVDLRSSATTYGLAGYPEADANVTYTGRNSLLVGDNARLEAQTGINPNDGTAPRSATIRLAAGKTLAGGTPTLAFNATADAYNKTAIPIPSAPNPDVVVANFGTVDIGTSSADTDGVRAAGNITIAASQGDIRARAKGLGKDIYREELAKAASAVSNAFGGGDVTFDYHGGRTSTNGGLAKVHVDGRVETGLRRIRQITFDYTTAPCNASSSACLSVTNDSKMDFETTGPDPVGTSILDRIEELEDLKEEYSDDPVALAAYNNEINFLQNKLADLGLGSFDSSGNFVKNDFAGQSPRQVLTDEANAAQRDVDTVETNLDGAATAGVTEVLTDYAVIIETTYTDTDNGIEKQTSDALAGIAAITTFDGTDPAQAARVTAATQALNEGKAAAAAVRTAEQDTIARKTTIANQTADIADAQNALAAAREAQDAGGESDALNRILAARSAIQTELNAISENTATIDTQKAIAEARAATVENELTLLVNGLPTASDSDDASADAARRAALLAAPSGSAATGGAIYNLGSAADALVDTVSALDGETGDISSRIATLTASTTTPGAVGATNNSLTQFVDLIDSLTETYAEKTIAARTASDERSKPLAFTLDIGDTLARLGNVSVEGDLLTGSGTLLVPGDAEISIVNNTSNTLRLGDLTIPTYDSGNLRMNGVIVHDNADIQELNASYIAQGRALPAGTATTAAFSEVVTRRTSSRADVTIQSNYNTDSLVYFDPTLSSDPNNPKANRRVPPDIILKSGSVIENTTGAVNIESAQGNIYINGQINAGSVNILAKNGDFVSSFVNGFNHVGGDPASFNSPTNAGERGPGITANGSVSIAARFLNINSRIQSGIADWNITLSSDPILTVAPEALGLSRADLDTTGTRTIQLGGGESITVDIRPIFNLGSSGVSGELAQKFEEDLNELVEQYKDEIVDNPDANPIRTIVVGVGTSAEPIQINLKDFLSGARRNRIEMTMSEARSYTRAKGGDGVYSTLASGNIGAVYDVGYDSESDTFDDHFVVNGTQVNGGYIEVFGQIINTSSSGGELRALDGFGQIDVVNNSGKPIVLGSLNTGKDPSGTLRGTEGRIRITDVYRVDASSSENPVVNVLVSDYTFNPGSNRVEFTRRKGVIQNDTGDIQISNSYPTATDPGRDATYTPGSIPGESTIYPRYIWNEQEGFRRVDRYTVTRDQFFGSDSLTFNQANSFSAGVPRQVDPTRRLADGTYLSTTRTVTRGPSQRLPNGIYVSQTPQSVTNESLNSDPFEDSQASYLKSQKLNLVSSSRDCNWWTLCVLSSVTDTYDITQRYNVITTNSLKANYPINIEFIGSNTGGISVTSNSDVVLRNALRNAAGDTSIDVTGGNIVQGSRAAEVEGVNIALTATGSVGGVTSVLTPDGPIAADAQVLATLTRAGEAVPVGGLTATATAGGVAVRTRGQMIVNQVTANNGTVDLIAQESILAKAVAGGATPPAYRVQGERVKLQAISGQIGEATLAGALTVNTAFVPGASGREFGDVALNPALRTDPAFGLTATASGDIGIRSTPWARNATGSILVEKVASPGGDVLLATTGRILDNQPQETIDSRSYDDLLRFWNTLGLRKDSEENIAKQKVQIVAFEAGQTQSYRSYWDTRQSQPDGGASYDPGFVVRVSPDTPEFEALSDTFRQQAIDDGVPPADRDAYVANAIADYEARQTTEYHELHESVGGFTADFDPGFAYDASDDEEKGLTSGAEWTERELAFTLAPGALKTITGTNPVIKEPNVSGRSVRLHANDGLGETINQGAGIAIPSSTDPRDLTLDQKVALAAAERSDLTLRLGRIDDPGASGTAEQRAAYARALAEGVTNPVGTTDIPLGTDFNELSAPLQAALDAAALGLVDADQTTLAVLVKRPLNFDTPGGLEISVTNAQSGVDGGNSYLASRGDSNLAQLSALGETRVKVRGDIRQGMAGTITTGNLILEAAQGAIGSISTPVQLALRPGATTVARAQDGVYLAFSGDGIIDTIYSPGDDPDTPFDITLTATSSLLNANDDDLINVLGTNVDLTAQSGSIGTLSRALNVGVNLGGGITATAAAEVNLFGPSSNAMVLRRVNAGGTIKLELGGAATIDGPVETPGAIEIVGTGRLVATGNAALRATAGDISISAGSVKLLNGSSTRTDAGRIVVAVDGDAVITGLSAGSSAAEAVKIDAGGRIFGGTVPGGTDISATAAGAGVRLTAGTGIGDRTRANDRALDRPGDAPGSANAETDAENPITIDAPAIAASTTDGGIALAALSDAAISAISAPGGKVTVSGQGDLAFGPVSSGGSQTLSAVGNLRFGTLVATGLAGDPGNISVTAGGDVAGDVVTAAGSAAISGASITFNTITSGADTSVFGTGPVSFGAIDAGANSSVSGDTVTFDSIVAALDNRITSQGDITGRQQIAGEAIIDRAGSATRRGDIRISIMQAKRYDIEASGEFEFDTIQTADRLDLKADTIRGRIEQVPSGPDPLRLTLTGGFGTTGTLADIDVDAPAGVIVENLDFVDTFFDTTASQVDFLRAFVPGSLVLTTPEQVIDVNNRSPRPRGIGNVQIFDIDKEFRLSVDGLASSSSAEVVFFDPAAESSFVPALSFDGVSLTRDSIRFMSDADSFRMPLADPLEDEEFADDLAEGNVTLVIDGIAYQVFYFGDGPAVMLERGD